MTGLSARACPFRDACALANSGDLLAYIELAGNTQDLNATPRPAGYPGGTLTRVEVVPLYWGA